MSTLMKNEDGMVVPTMLTIRETMNRLNTENSNTRFSYALLKGLCAEGKIVFITHGSRIYINYEKLLEYLNTNTVLEEGWDDKEHMEEDNK